jgi:hypothetical protein
MWPNKYQIRGNSCYTGAAASHAHLAPEPRGFSGYETGTTASRLSPTLPPILGGVRKMHFPSLSGPRTGYVHAK